VCNPELALDTVAEGGARVLDSALIRECDLNHDDIERLVRTAGTPATSATLKSSNCQSDLKWVTALIIPR
jgi:hypothetical protein